MTKRWFRLVSTRRYVERVEARLHRLAASCTLAARDMPEEAIGDPEQRAIRHHLLIAEKQLEIVLDVYTGIRDERRRKLTRAKFAQPINQREGEPGYQAPA